MFILERLASAVHTSNLKSDPRTSYSDSDVIGAAGLAAKYEPLGIAITDLLTGGRAAGVIEELSSIGFRKARTLRIKISTGQARAVATAVLSWYRHGKCQPCGGTGYRTIPGTPVHGDECSHCRGTTNIPFESQFRQEWQPLARWLHAEIERSQVSAGIAAMKLIAPKLDF